MVNGKKKDQPRLADVIAALKIERENMSPMNSTVLELYDMYIEELERVLDAQPA